MGPGETPKEPETQAAPPEPVPAPSSDLGKMAERFEAELKQIRDTQAANTASADAREKVLLAKLEEIGKRLDEPRKIEAPQPPPPPQVDIERLREEAAAGNGSAGGKKRMTFRGPLG